jgi:hypothetical protein
MPKLIGVVTRKLQPLQAQSPIMPGVLEPWQLRWAPRAFDAYRDHASDTRKIPEGRKRSLSIRTPEMATRYASVVALWCGTREVGDEHFEWGWQLAVRSRDMILNGANENMKAKRGFKHVCEFIKEALSEGPLRWTELRLKLRSSATDYGMENVEKALLEVITCGEVREINKEEALRRGLRRSLAGADGKWYELC